MATGVLIPSYRQRVGYHAMLLGGIALLASMLLTVGNNQTYRDIELRKAEDLQASLAQVIPPAIHDNDLLADTLRIEDGDGTPLTIYRATRGGAVVAVAFEVSAPGYAGPIVSVIGVDAAGALLGVRVIRHSETPGLGDKMEVARGDWIHLFDGLSLGNPPAERWGVKKDGGHFDQFTGATITPRAVVRSIKGGLELFGQQRQRLLAPAIITEPTVTDTPTSTDPAAALPSRRDPNGVVSGGENNQPETITTRPATPQPGAGQGAEE